MDLSEEIFNPEVNHKKTETIQKLLEFFQIATSGLQRHFNRMRIKSQSENVTKHISKRKDLFFSVLYKVILLNKL